MAKFLEATKMFATELTCLASERCAPVSISGIIGSIIAKMSDVRSDWDPPPWDSPSSKNESLMRTKQKEPQKAMRSKSLETKLQNELIQPGLMGSKCPDTLVRKELIQTMNNGHNSSSVPTTIDNGHNSSSVPSDSGHYNDDATLVDDALLK